MSSHSLNQCHVIIAKNWQNSIKCKPCRKSMPLFTEKRPSYWYRRSHYKPEAVVRSSLVCNGDFYIRKATSILVNHVISLIIKKQYLNKNIESSKILKSTISLNSKGKKQFSLHFILYNDINRHESSHSALNDLMTVSPLWWKPLTNETRYARINCPLKYSAADISSVIWYPMN